MYSSFGYGHDALFVLITPPQRPAYGRVLLRKLKSEMRDLNPGLLQVSLAHRIPLYLFFSLSMLKRCDVFKVCFSAGEN
jgi:hypothetical protein